VIRLSYFYSSEAGGVRNCAYRAERNGERGQDGIKLAQKIRRPREWVEYCGRYRNEDHIVANILLWFNDNVTLTVQ